MLRAVYSEGQVSAVSVPESYAIHQQRPASHIASPISTTSSPGAPDHPLLADIIARNLPARRRTVRAAWTATLLSMPHENGLMWLQNLQQATLDASGVHELMIVSRVRIERAGVADGSSARKSSQNCFRLHSLNVTCRSRIPHLSK